MAITTVDKNRRDPVLKRADVSTVLPEWFEQSNPKLIKFLEETDNYPIESKKE